MDRRTFLAASGAAGLASTTSGSAADAALGTPFESPLLLSADGPMFTPVEFAAQLQRSIAANISADVYGEGGATAELEQFIAQAVGKEAAVFLPTGTLANQLAIRILAGSRPGVVVQDQSHVFRDEFDMAQVSGGKTLVNLAPNGATFSGAEFQSVISARAGGVGAVSIETPVRRLHGERFDFREMERISHIARENGIGRHLDGARLFIESAYSDLPLRRYADLFDTVYICLYKCFGAGSGAVLCGSRAHIAEAIRLRNLMGARLFATWPNAAVALHLARGFETRFAGVRLSAERFFERLNDSGLVKVSQVERGTNVYRFEVSRGSPEEFRKKVAGNGIRWAGYGFTPGYGLFRVNETWAYMDEGALLDRMRAALA